MQVSELRARVQDDLLDFAWSEWGQMGVLATPTRTSPWAADPEALLLFTFEVGRADPRLLDEVLDWLVVNGRLVSQQRIRNLSVDGSEQSLANAALAWASQHQRALRAAGARKPSGETRLEPLIRGSAVGGRSDPVFAAHGWFKPQTEPSGKSKPPQLRAPINFAFRLRRLFGTGSRAEIVRFLVSSRLPGAQAEVVRRAAGFAKRNVLDTANELVAAGVLGSYTLGASRERFYNADLNAWCTFLELEPGEIPIHRDWPQLLASLRILYRELLDPRWDEYTDYLRASEARQLMKRVEPDLSFAGVPVRDTGSGSDYWETFVGNVEATLSALAQPFP